MRKTVARKEGENSGAQEMPVLPTVARSYGVLFSLEFFLLGDASMFFGC